MAPKDTPPVSPKRVPPVVLGKLIDPTLVVFFDGGPAKNDAIKDLVGRLVAAKNLGPADLFLAKVMEREAGPSTTLDTGLCIPHARVQGLQEVTAALGLFHPEIADPLQPDLSIRCMFLFLSPDDPKFIPVNLQVLRRIAQVFQPAFIEKLHAAKTPQKVFDLIQQKDG